MSSHPPAPRFLVAWYALYQAAHLVVNGRFLATGKVPFAPPPGGWTDQTSAFLVGMAGADLVNAALALVFAAGFFGRRPWVGWLGTVVLTVSVYAAVAFTWGAVVAGALPARTGAYLYVYVPFAPVVVLYAVWLRGRAAGAPRPYPSPPPSHA